MAVRSLKVIPCYPFMQLEYKPRTYKHTVFPAREDSTRCFPSCQRASASVCSAPFQGGAQTVWLCPAPAPLCV